MKEFIEVSERQSYAELKAFLRRCWDVTEFLHYIVVEVDKQKRGFRELMM